MEWGPPEHPVALLHELPVRPQRRVARQQEARVLESLQAVLQHRPVRLAENIRTQLHRQVRPHAQDVPIERRVVQLAQRQPVRHHRLAPRMPVRQDVCRVEQLLVSQPADGALLAVGPQHPLPELLLVHALLAEPRHIRTPDGVSRLRDGVHSSRGDPAVVHGGGTLCLRMFLESARRVHGPPGGHTPSNLLDRIKYSVGGTRNSRMNRTTWSRDATVSSSPPFLMKPLHWARFASESANSSRRRKIEPDGIGVPRLVKVALMACANLLPEKWNRFARIQTS